MAARSYTPVREPTIVKNIIATKVVCCGSTNITKYTLDWGKDSSKQKKGCMTSAKIHSRCRK